MNNKLFITYTLKESMFEHKINNVVDFQYSVALKKYDLRNLKYIKAMCNNFASSIVIKSINNCNFINRCINDKIGIIKLWENKTLVATIIKPCLMINMPIGVNSEEKLMTFLGYKLIINKQYKKS